MEDELIQMKQVLNEAVHAWDGCTTLEKRRTVLSIIHRGAKMCPLQLSEIDDLPEAAQLECLKQLYSQVTLELEQLRESVRKKDREMRKQMDDQRQEIVEQRQEIAEQRQEITELKMRVDQAQKKEDINIAKALAGDLVYLLQDFERVENIRDLSKCFPYEKRSLFSMEVGKLKDEQRRLGHSATSQTYDNISWDELESLFRKKLEWSSDQQRFHEFFQFVKSHTKLEKPFATWNSIRDAKYASFN